MLLAARHGAFDESFAARRNYCERHAAEGLTTRSRCNYVRLANEIRILLR